MPVSRKRLRAILLAGNGLLTLHMPSRVFADTAAGYRSTKIPSNLPRGDGVFIRVEVSAIGAADPSWAVPANLYFRKTGNTWRLVGFERIME